MLTNLYSRARIFREIREYFSPQKSPRHMVIITTRVLIRHSREHYIVVADQFLGRKSQNKLKSLRINVGLQLLYSFIV